MKYTEKEKLFLNRIKSKTIDNCKLCNNGFKEDRTECDCLITFYFIKELALSKIPESYWFLEFKELKIKSSIKMLISEYIKNINNALDKNLGFTFFGTNGTGKTSVMSVIGIQTIIKQKRVLYIRMKEIFDNIFKEDETLKERIKSADLILLDEFDKLYHKSQDWNIYNIDDFIRENFDRKSIIICTNFAGGEEIKEIYGDSILSKILEFNKFVPFSGNDFRKEMNDKWLERLKAEKIDYMKLLEQAKIYKKYRLEKDKEEYDIVI